MQSLTMAAEISCRHETVKFLFHNVQLHLVENMSANKLVLLRAMKLGLSLAINGGPTT